MIHPTKIALIIKSDLLTWQKVNVAAFLSSGITAKYPQLIGENYADGSNTMYLPMFGQPVFVFGGDHESLLRALDRALAREVPAVIYTEEIFTTDNDIDNRAAVKVVQHEHLRLVGIACYAESKVIDKITDKLKFLQ